jgi:phosphatidylglycerophosphate synthase
VRALVHARPSSLEDVAGLPIAVRAALVLQRAGATEVTLVAADAAVREALSRHARLGGVQVVADAPAGDALVIAEDAVFDIAWAKAALAGATGGLHRPARDAAERREARRALFAALRKPSDGVVSVYLNRPMSLSVTRLLLPTGITPNQMTVVANVIGALGVWFVFRGGWGNVAIGGTLVHLQSVLDGCDGEIARLKLQASTFGEWFDNVLDDVVNSTYGLALAWVSGWWWMGIAAFAAIWIYNAVLYHQLATVHHTGNPFAFRWWFQSKDEDLGASLGGPLAAVRSLARRDLFLFAFMLLCLAGVPQVAATWYALVAVGHFMLTVVHLVRTW